MGILRGGIITTSAGGGGGGALPSGTSGILSINSEYGPHITLSSDASIQITKPTTNNIQFSCSGFVSGVQQQIEAKLAVSGQELLNTLNVSGQTILSSVVGSVGVFGGADIQGDVDFADPSGFLVWGDTAGASPITASIDTHALSGLWGLDQINVNKNNIDSKPDKYYAYFNNFGSGYFNHGLNTQLLTWNVYASGTTVEAIDPDRFRVMDENHIFLKFNSPETGFVVIMG